MGGFWESYGIIVCYTVIKDGKDIELGENTMKPIVLLKAFLLTTSMAIMFIIASLTLLNFMSVSAQDPAKSKSGIEQPQNSRLAALAPLTGCIAIRPGDVVTDAADVFPDSIDLLTAATTLSGQWLTATLYLYDLPFEATPSDSDPTRYWEIYIDTDNNPLTGFDASDARQGADYSITVVQSSSAVTQPFADSLSVEVWRYGRTEWDVFTDNTLFSVDVSPDIMIASALIADSPNIPGVSSGSRLVFWNEDFVGSQNAGSAEVFIINLRGGNGSLLNTVVMTRDADGYFDDSTFNGTASTIPNRGFIYIDHIA